MTLIIAYRYKFVVIQRFVFIVCYFLLPVVIKLMENSELIKETCNFFSRGFTKKERIQ